MTINYNTLSPSAYKAQRDNFIGAKEGLRSSAYCDHRGVPTIGYGVNLRVYANKVYKRLKIDDVALIGELDALFKKTTYITSTLQPAINEILVRHGRESGSFQISSQFNATNNIQSQLVPATEYLNETYGHGREYDWDKIVVSVEIEAQKNISDMQSGTLLIGRKGGTNHLTGTDYDDVLFGSDYNDILYGGNGNNIFNAGAGNDYMYGGFDDDMYIYTTGRDKIYDTGGENDTLRGQSHHKYVIHNGKQVLFDVNGVNYLTVEEGWMENVSCGLRNVDASQSQSDVASVGGVVRGVERGVNYVFADTATIYLGEHNTRDAEYYYGNKFNFVIYDVLSDDGETAVIKCIDPSKNLWEVSTSDGWGPYAYVYGYNGNPIGSVELRELPPIPINPHAESDYVINTDVDQLVQAIASFNPPQGTASDTDLSTALTETLNQTWQTKTAA